MKGFEKNFSYDLYFIRVIRYLPAVIFERTSDVVVKNIFSSHLGLLIGKVTGICGILLR